MTEEKGRLQAPSHALLGLVEAHGGQGARVVAPFSIRGTRSVYRPLMQSTALPSCQVIECDIAPQVASRAVNVAPYKVHSPLSLGTALSFTPGCCCPCCFGCPCRRLACCRIPPPRYLPAATLPALPTLNLASFTPPQGKHAQGSGGEAAADIYRQAAAADPGPSTSARPPRGGPVGLGGGTLHVQGEP